MNFHVFSSLLGMQLKGLWGVKCTIFQNLVLCFMVFLGQDNMTEHDRIFVFVYVNSYVKLNSGMWVGAGSRGVGTTGVKSKNLFLRGGRAI